MGGLAGSNFRLLVCMRGDMLDHMDEIWKKDSIIAHSAIMARSFRRFTGRDVLPGLFNPLGLSRNLFVAPFVVVSHGTEVDPVLNYGNQAGLNLWEMSWDELTRTPSRLTAEMPEQEERARLLAAVTERGFIDDYSGIRISKSGRRFRIAKATVWNLVTERNEPYGQAAMFDYWEFL